MSSGLFQAYEPKPPPVYAVYVTYENVEELARELSEHLGIATRLERGGMEYRRVQLFIKDGEDEEVAVHPGQVLIVGKPYTVMSDSDFHRSHREYLDARKWQRSLDALVGTLPEAAHHE